MDDGGLCQFAAELCQAASVEKNHFRHFNFALKDTVGFRAARLFVCVVVLVSHERYTEYIYWCKVRNYM